MRIGQGCDIHKLVEGRPFILGGVKIPYNKGLLGHSDADVLVHAIIDALLGAMGEKDIGSQFSDSDPRYKDANSLNLLNVVAQMLVRNSYRIENIDSTVMCQDPKLAPYLDNMKENICNVLKINKGMLSIKAKTNEGLDSIGAGEAVAATAVVLLN